jgi:predicted amidohydrolase YtcJ
MGTQAHEENLSRLEAIAKEFDIRSLKWILNHAVFIEPEQVKRYAQLNMDFTTSMSFCWGKGELFRQRMDKVNFADLMPLRRFFDAGFAVAAGSDWGPKNPYEQMQLALTHEFAGSRFRNLGPDQKISRRQAIGMWTDDAARVLQWQGIGSLSPGNHADLVVVDRDLMNCEVEEIGSAKTRLTLVGGEPVYDAGLLG